MIRACLAALAALVFATTATAEEIEVIGVGRADAPAARALVTAMSANFFSGEYEEPTETLDTDPIADLIRRADPTAREASVDAAMFGDEYAPYAEALGARAGLLQYNVDAGAIERIERNLAPFRSLLRVHYEGVAGNPGELRAAAMRAALANAREKAEVIAAAAGLRLGDVVRIQQGVSTSAAPVTRFMVVTVGQNRQPPDLPLRAESNETLTVVFSAQR